MPRGIHGHLLPIELALSVNCKSVTGTLKGRTDKSSSVTFLPPRRSDFSPFQSAAGACSPRRAGNADASSTNESSHPLEARDRCQHDLHGSLRHPVTFPLGRVGRPDDTAIAVSFLALDQSSFGPGQLHLRDRA